MTIGECGTIFFTPPFFGRDGKGQEQPACQREWKKCEEENE
jgi:hypothetical protein